MATPNYGYEKRQRELAKKKKKEEKLRAKAADRRPESADHAQPDEGNLEQGSDHGGAGADLVSEMPPSPQGQTAP